MHTFQKPAIALALLVAACASHAQQSATAGTPAGRLGQRYIGASFGITDIRNAPETVLDTSIGINLPVTPSIDVDFGYGYQWLRNSPVDATGQSIDAGATLYTNTHGVKPFVSASLGYLWSKASYAGFSQRSDFSGYSVGLGVEIPVRAITITPGLSYDDNLEHGGDGIFTVGADVHYWVTRKVAVRVSLASSDENNDFDTLNYRVGLRLKF